VYHRWIDEQPTLVANPDYAEAKAAEREREQLWNEAFSYGLEVLKIPARPPRGLLIKLAIAIEAKRLEHLPAQLEAWLHDGLETEGLLPALLVDLQAMVAEA
jgi:hypothetical protein